MPRGIPFEKGREKTGGRKPSIKTQLKRFEDKHPEAYDKLMEILYEKGLEGSSLDAQYVVDRLKGKPTAKVGLDEADRELLSVATMLEFYKMLDTHDRKELKEGEYAIQGEGLNSEGEDEEASGEEARRNG